MKTYVAIAAICLVGLAACNSSDAKSVGAGSTTSLDSVTPSPSLTRTPSGTPSPSPSPTASAASDDGCSNEAAVLATPGLTRPGSLRGDVDGDGRPDTVRIALDPSGATGCQAFVAVRTASGTQAAAAIRQWEPTPVLPAPHLNSVARIDGAPGGEVVVDVAAGASTQFEGVYTYSAGTLVPVTIKGTPFTGLFAYGGSVGHLDGEACNRRGTVVISGALAKGSLGTRYKVVRRFFRPGTGVLKYRPRRTQRKTLSPAALQRLREFSGAPFAGCPIA